MDGEQKLIAIFVVAYFIFMGLLIFMPDESSEKYAACVKEHTPAQCEDVD